MDDARRPVTRLAAYGTLRPGESNHGVVAGIRGTWTPGVVRGRLHADGFGPVRGYPVLGPDPNGDAIPVVVLESDDLPAHWRRLDEFEGEGYMRAVVPVELAGGAVVEACAYVASGARAGPGGERISLCPANRIRQARADEPREQS